MSFFKKLLLGLVICLALPVAAQTAVPETFKISDKELSAVLSGSVDSKLSTPSNPFLNGAMTIKNVRNGDMQFVRLKLAYFKNAFLNVQVNGIYTTQVFLLSEDGATFYRGQAKNGTVLMEKCSKDDIVVE